MADEVLQPDYSAFTSRALGGYATPQPVEPKRSAWEAVKDTALDTAANVVGVARSVGGVGDAVQTAISAKAPTEHPRMDALSDIEAGLRNQRSDNAKYIDENGGPTWSRDPLRSLVGVGTGIIPYAPLAFATPIGAAAGAAALSYGRQQSEDRERARSGNMDDNSQYLSLIQSGMTDKEAREQLYQNASDPTKLSTWGRRIPGMVGESAGWGAGAAFTHGLMRKTTEHIVDSVLAKTATRTALIGAGEGAVAGAVQGAGTDWSRQQSEVDMGLRGSVDYGETAGAAVEPAALLGGFGAVGKGRERAQMVRQRRPDATAPPIGTTTLAVAAAEEHGEQPGLPEGGYVDPATGPSRAPQPNLPGAPGEIPEGGWVNSPARPVRTPGGPGEIPEGGFTEQPSRPPTRGPSEYPEGGWPTDRPANAPSGPGEIPEGGWASGVAPGGPQPPQPMRRSAEHIPEGGWMGSEPHPPEGPWAPGGVRQPAMPSERAPVQPPAPAEPGPAREPWSPEKVPYVPREMNDQPADPWHPGYVEPVTKGGGGGAEGGGGAPPAPTTPPTPTAPPVAKGAARVKEVARKRKGEKVASSKEEGRPQEGPAAEAVARAQPEAQAGGKEEGRTPEVVSAEPAKALAKAAPEPADLPAKTAGIGPKGKGLLSKMKTKVREQIASAGTTLADRLDPKQRLEVEHLQKKMSEFSNKPLETLAKEAIRDAHYDPRNFKDRLAQAVAKRAEDKKQAGRVRKAARTAPVRAVREELVKNALSEPGKSMADLAKGANRTVREQFDEMIKGSHLNENGKIIFRDMSNEALSSLAGHMIGNAETRIKSAQMAMERYGRSGRANVSQVPMGMPKARSKAWENNPWYSALYDLNTIKNALQKYSGKDTKGNTEIKSGSAAVMRTLMTDLYIQDRAIETGKIHLWDRYKKERAKDEYSSLIDRRDFLRRETDRMQRDKDIIDEVEGRFNNDAKVNLSDADRSEYERARDRYKENVHKSRSAELVKQERKVAEAHASAGMDLYNQGQHVGADFENRLHEFLDDPEMQHRNLEGAEAFIRSRLMEEADEASIQRARDEKRLHDMPGEPVSRPKPLKPRASAVAGLDDIARRNKPEDIVVPKRETLEERTARETKASKRVLEIDDEAARLNDDMEALPLHEQASDARLRELSDRMKELRDEQRGLAEDANPSMLNDEYSIGRVLDPAADLEKKGNLPAGSYVRTVSDFLKPGRTLTGRDTSIRPSGETREAALQNHVFDVANKMFGNMKVVGLTAEQMGLAAAHRLLPPETMAFYDPKAGRLFISHEAGRPDSEAFKRVLGHEIVHPLSEVAIEHFPEIGNRIDAVRQTLVKEVLREGSDAARILKGNEQGLVDTHEFLSEFFNDGGLIQSALDTIKSGRRTKAGGFASALTRLKEVIGDGLNKLFLRTTHRTALSDAMVHSLDLFRQTEERFLQGTLQPVRGERARAMTADWDSMAPDRDSLTKRTAGSAHEWMADRIGATASALRRLDGGTGIALWGHDLAQMTRRAEPGMQHVTEGVRTAMAHSFTSTKRINEEAHVDEIAGKIGRAINESGPGVWDKFQDYYDRENQSSVSGSDPLGRGRNAWIDGTIKKNQPALYRQYEMEHAALAHDYALLPERMREIRNDLRAAYDKRNEDLSYSSLQQLIETNGMAPDAVTRDTLAKFIREPKSLTTADNAMLAAKVPGFSEKIDRKRTDPEYLQFRQHIREIRQLAHLRKIPGVWYPKFRKGDWVVEGKFNLDKMALPNGGREVAGTRGAWDFDSAAARDKYVSDIQTDPVMSKIKFLGTQDIKPSAPDGAPVFRATHNPLMLDFHQSRYEAEKQHAALREAYGDKIKMTHVEPRKEDQATFLNAVKADRALKAMMDSLHKSPNWADLDAASKKRLERDMTEGAVRHIMSASQRATYLPRQYALGSRKDVMQDFLDYMVNTSYSLAELRHREELKKSYRAMDDYVRDMKDSAGPGDPQGKFGALRRQIQASLHRRADMKPDAILSPVWKKGIARVMQLSYLDKLASPANWVLNGTELLMSGAPMLAGVHGIRAYAEIARALNDLGVHHYLDGFRDSTTVARAGIGGVPKLPDVPKRFRDMTANLPDAKAIHAMIGRLEEYAHLDRDSSMEVGRLFDPAAGKTARGVDYFDNVSRQITANIDNMNRVALGIAAMRLATREGRGGGKDMAGALAHAEKYVGKMAGNYAKYNEAEMFRHPLLGPALQFKRYAQRMTANWLGAAFHAAGLGDATPEQRSVARHQLAYMASTVLLMSGALGLPTEPIKGVINLFSPLTGFNSDDMENSVRNASASVFGNDVGYAVARGVPRAYLDWGIGTRLGYDSLWTQGAPGDKPDSMAAAAFHLAGGAPLAGLMEWVEGLGRMGKGTLQLANGEDNEGWNNLRHGAQLAIPIKALADNIDAWANHIGGPETRTRFGQPLGIQPSLGDTIMQGAGFRTGASQERGDMRRQMSRDRSSRVEQRNEAYAMYVNASTQGEKASIRKMAMDKFNANWSEDPLTVGDFLKAEQRHRKNMATLENNPERAGLNMSRRDQRLLPRYSAYQP